MVREARLCRDNPELSSSAAHHLRDLADDESRFRPEGLTRKRRERGENEIISRQDAKTAKSAQKLAWGK